MYSFKNDYSEIAHERILLRLVSEQTKQFEGYSEDRITEQVREKIRKLTKNDKCHVHMMSGGTQCNLIAISHVLKSYQGVISTGLGHIATHETGAIEATGHKVITLDSSDGKLYANEVEKVLNDYANDEVYEHVVEPAMVYISNPTELGTIYTKCELESLRETCNKYGASLYMDGARLASALAAKNNDVSLSDIAKNCDMFYIGGTKCGAMYGECLVIVNEEYKKSFRNYMKQKGAMISKGYNLSLQFDELFTDDLYFKIGRYQDDLAEYVARKLSELGVEFLQEQVTNQVFPILSNKLIGKLEETYGFHRWGAVSESTSAIRLCISFKTDKSKIDDFIEEVRKFYI